MTIRLRTAFFIILGIITIWFFWIERAILTPFLLASIFAYIFNPVINFLSRKIKLPRSLSIIIIYLAIIALFAFIGTLITKRVLDESSYFTSNIKNLESIARYQINALPSFIRPLLFDTVSSIEQIKFVPSLSLISIFPQAFSRIINIFVFLFAAFYFLKEGKGMFDKIINFIPNDYKVEVEILIRKMNAVLADYLRGQILLVILMILMLFVSLSILGVRFALILAIFSGLAEIVPIIGPIIAGAIGALVVFFSGTTSFGLSTPQVTLIVIAIYFVTRQIQDYLLAPHVMGKLIKLHPLIIFFAVLAGGHIGGILGVILAVPVAGMLRILLEFFLDEVNKRSAPRT